MKVIAKNNGPIFEKWDGTRERQGLKEGKVYDIIEWAYQDEPGHWVVRTDTDNFLNPKETKFFIKVVNEFGKQADYWNDYFLSSEEMRERKLNRLLNSF